MDRNIHGIVVHTGTVLVYCIAYCDLQIFFDNHYTSGSNVMFTKLW